MLICAACASWNVKAFCISRLTGRERIDNMKEPRLETENSIKSTSAKETSISAKNQIRIEISSETVSEFREVRED
jgi:hypothetical protein